MTSSPSRLRAGIIGLSWIGADPAGPASDPLLGTAPPYSHASAFAALGDVDVVAVCDLRNDAVDGFVAQWGDRWGDIARCSTADELLAHDLDVVSIAVPDHLHGTVLQRCLDAGVPAIFAEKPFTTDLDEADALLDRISETGTLVCVNHTWRWRPEMMEARALIRSGQLGPVSQITIEAGGPRAMLFRNLSHFLDLAVFLSDGTPTWVTGELERGAREYGVKYQGDGGTDPALDPGATALIGFDNGARAFVSALKSSSSDIMVSVSCEQGRIIVDMLGARIVSTQRGNDGTPGSVQPPSIRSLAPRFTRVGMHAALAHLVDAHRRGERLQESAHSARTTVAVIDAILRSQANGNQRTTLR